MKALKPFRVRLSSYTDTVKLVFAGDLHYASAESAHEYWWRMFEENQDAYFILMGDILHSISCADKRWGTTKLRKEFYHYDNLVSLIDAEVDLFVKDMKRRLGERWIKEHIIGSLSGNHPSKATFSALGFDPHLRMCRELEIENLGYSCIFPFQVEIGGKLEGEVLITCHHGFGGGGRTEGGNLTKFARHAYGYDGNIHAYGHCHQLLVADLPFIRYRKGREPWVEVSQRLLVLSGTFQRALSRGVYPSYAEILGLPIRPLGYVIVDCRIKKVGSRRFLNLRGEVRAFYD